MKIVQTIEAIALFPRSGRIVPEYNDPDIREKFHNNYRIVYRLKDEGQVIEVAAITHGAKPLEDVL